LVIDVGGGSTEFVVGDDAPLAATSIDIGSVRLTERLLVERPASKEQVAAATDLVRRMFAPVAIPGPPVRAIGVAGTFTSLAAIHLGLAAYDRARVDGSTLTVSDLDRLVANLSRLTIEETEAIPSLQADRAPVLLGGAVVVREAVRRCGLGRVTVSETDLLDGIVLGLAG
jgi:exopolyphosphatase/guanosine-5'-triphosphate,3'-diphosphate pyrophosphatase